MSTQALLQALSFSQTSAIGLAATANWIIKDGFGLLGGVLYAAMISSKFDAQPKRYRFIATLSLQLATFLELLTPLLTAMWSPSFLILASLSNIGKNIAWLAISATRASIHKSLIRFDNLGDVTAKSGAQNTAAGLIGTGLGVIISFTLGTSPALLLSVWAPLLGLNLWTLAQGNKCVITRTFDLERSERVFISFICKGLVLSPDAVSKEESFIFAYKSIFSTPIVMEGPLLSLLQTTPRPILDSVFSRRNFVVDELTGKGLVSLLPPPKEEYFLWHDTEAQIMRLWYTPSCTSRDMIKGFYHACRARYLLGLDGDRSGVVREAYEDTRRDFDVLVEDLEAVGWSCDGSHLGDTDRRVLYEDFEAESSGVAVSKKAL